jgi:hypothetical protein
MSIFYSENEAPFKGEPTPYHKMPATKFYLNHYNNMLILKAIEQRPKNPQEKQQATREIAICQRKLDYWSKHPNFDQETVTRECAALKKLWG